MWMLHESREVQGMPQRISILRSHAAELLVHPKKRKLHCRFSIEDDRKEEEGLQVSHRSREK